MVFLNLSLSLYLSLFLSLSLSLSRMLGYYFEIRSICAIRINTQVGLSSAFHTADPWSLSLVHLGILISGVVFVMETFTE